MAKGDAVGDVQSIADGAFLDILPTGGAEWVLHNIIHEDTVELWVTDNAATPVSVVALTDPGRNVLGNLQLHAKADYYYRIKNISGATKIIAYDGFATK